MTTVYIVSTGPDDAFCEDYQTIHGVFSSIEKAEAFITLVFGENKYGYIASIEEWELNQPRSLRFKGAQ